jgi:carbon-monoxide dehydrogenase large subunit
LLARDAAECIVVDYEALDAVTDPTAAAEPDAPRTWPELANNFGVDSPLGDEEETAAAFEKAAHVIRQPVYVGRVTGVPMEPRAAVAAYDADSDYYTLYAGGGGAWRHQGELALLCGVPEDRFRLVSGDVGGSFGTRNRVYPEFPLLLLATRRLGRPVKWTATRSETMISDLQGRDLVSDVSLALDDSGKFLALRGVNTSNTGGYPVAYAPLSKGAGIATGPYLFPTAAMQLRAVFTNTPPTNPYRSAGRPECVHALERLIDTAARQLGMDRIALRRRNLIRPDQLPHVNPQGLEYDSGEFEACLDLALKEADYDGFGERRAKSEAGGLRRGIGIAPYIETSSGAALEWASMTIKPDGIDVVVGTQSTGQGHETSYSQVAADWLGVPFDKIAIIQGDTAIVKSGNGTHGGRSMRMAGTAIVLAAEQVIEKGKALAAHVLEAATDDIAFDNGRFNIKGTDRSVDWLTLAEHAGPGDLTAELENIMHEAVFPNGCHVCEVIVDVETGVSKIERYTAVDDVGTVINPLIVDGQIHGGIVQGAGQALMERCFFDPDNAQPLCGSLMDYALPRADDMPSFKVICHEVPSPQNPLGVKSGGESGTTPALAVIINAIVDALAPLGVTDIEMPATPHRVWQAIQDAR